MKKTKKILLRTEFYNAKLYSERLFIVIKQINTQLPHHNGEFKRELALFYFDLINTASLKIFQNQLSTDNFLTYQSITLQIDEILNTLSILEKMLSTDTFSEQYHLPLIELINICYHHCFNIHQHIQASIPNIEIALPRTLSAKVDKSNNLEKYTLDETAIIETDNLLGPISLLRQQRYQEFLHKGHQALESHNHTEALVFFQKAQNYQETAEILTLIAQVHTTLENYSQAFKDAFRATQLDLDYGPAYNQVGAILLKDGKLQESLEWFERAKTCPNFLHREYSFINAGRVHMMQNNFPKALEEFASALALDPANHELHETVIRVRNLQYRSHNLNIKSNLTL